MTAQIEPMKLHHGLRILPAITANDRRLTLARGDA